VNEVSGIVASRIHPGIVYVHNDKGDGPRFFALDTTNGNVRATFHVTAGAHNYDWEDLAYGHCGGNDSGYGLYLGKYNFQIIALYLRENNTKLSP